MCKGYSVSCVIDCITCKMQCKHSGITKILKTNENALILKVDVIAIIEMEGCTSHTCTYMSWLTINKNFCASMGIDHSKTSLHAY